MLCLYTQICNNLPDQDDQLLRRRRRRKLSRGGKKKAAAEGSGLYSILNFIAPGENVFLPSISRHRRLLI